MFDALSLAEIDGQHAELLPARTVLSVFSMFGNSVGSGCDNTCSGGSPEPNQSAGLSGYGAASETASHGAASETASHGAAAELSSNGAASETASHGGSAGLSGYGGATETASHGNAAELSSNGSTSGCDPH